MNEAIKFTFGDIRQQSSHLTWMNVASSRAILATTNNFVDEFNMECLNQLNEEEIVIPSVDSTVDPNDATHYPVEYINMLKLSGITPHKLMLKRRCGYVDAKSQHKWRFV